VGGAEHAADVAPCFPGATLTEYEGDSFTGTVKVKLGPISLTYKGKGTYVTRDEDAHKVVIEATGATRAATAPRAQRSPARWSPTVRTRPRSPWSPT
jgi:carbon monoxide dehydrogenase subunit G